jgi:hypothetical protein
LSTDDAPAIRVQASMTRTAFKEAVARVDHLAVGLVDDALSGVFGAVVADAARVRRPRRRPRRFVRVVGTPWPRVAATCVGFLVAGVVALAVLLIAFLGTAMGDDTLGIGLLIILGPVAIGGLGALFPMVAGGVALANRSWAGDGSVRVELGLVGVGSLLLLVLPYLTTLWWPIGVAALPGVVLVVIALWPEPWREVPQLYIDWSSATSTADS